MHSKCNQREPRAFKNQKSSVAEAQTGRGDVERQQGGQSPRQAGCRACYAMLWTPVFTLRALGSHQMILSRKGGICISKRPLSHTGHQLNMEQAKGGGWCNLGEMMVAGIRLVVGVMWRSKLI